MADKKFNLLREPWILAMRPDGGEEEVSLTEIFRRAPQFSRLAGELPTQDVAVLRLLLAILHAVFGRYDPSGNFSPLYAEGDWRPTPRDALDRWQALWKRGAFPMEIIEKYLLRFEDRFYLFHPERPFYQVPALDKGTEYPITKLNGELSESNNKIRLFPQRTGRSKNELTYGEATRWLLYVNAFDDSSSKTKEQGLGSPGLGWLGKLGLVTAIGNNFFETLLLNLVLLRDGGETLWGEEKPVWEEEKVRIDERVPVSIPDNLSQLLSLQSRRLLLKRKGQRIEKYILLGGDFYSESDVYIEQMTIWENAAKKRSSKPEFCPKQHTPDHQLWRDFSALAVQTESDRRPGIVNWLVRLTHEGLIPRALINIQIASVQYDSKNCSVEDVFSDSVSFNAGLLTDFDQSWIGRILDAIETAALLANQAGWLAQNIAKAAGNTNKKSYPSVKSAAQERAYYLLDIPFRQWLEKIDPIIQKEEVSKSKASDAWWETARQTVRNLGRELVAQAGVNAFVGREMTENEKTQRYTTTEAYNRFLYYTSNREVLKGGKGNGR